MNHRKEQLTEEAILQLLMESDDESPEEEINGSFWDFPEEYVPVNHEIEVTRSEIKKPKKTRVEIEQEINVDEDDPVVEEEPNPMSLIPIASITGLENYEIASNINFEIIDELQHFNLTPKSAIKWKYVDYDRSEVNFENYDYIEENENEAYDCPGEYFKKYFTNELFELMVQYTNIYAFQNNKTSFKNTNVTELQKLIGLHIFFGTTGFPQLKMYWDNFIGIKLVSDVMSKNRFHALRTNLHFVDNLAASDEERKDKYFKLRPLLNAIRSRLLQLEPERNLCVDEQMIPFKGHLSIKQYIKGKPCPWGLKVYVLCGKSGQPYDFLMYQGANTEIPSNLKQQFGVAAAIVLHLCQRLEKKGYNLFFDNYFTSYALLEVLKQKEINAAGTVRINRFANPPFTSDHLFKKKNRGEVEELVSRDNKLVILKWLDNRSVHLASNFVGKGNMGTVQRYDSKLKKIVTINQPEIVKLYNHSMGGVDLLDQYISYYRIFIKSTKYTLRVITHFLDFAISSSWIEYRREMSKRNKKGKEVLDLLNFRLQIAQFLIHSNTGNKRGRPRNDNVLNESNNAKKIKREFRPIKEVQYDGYNHFPLFDGKKEATRCKQPDCIERTHLYCEKCKVHLCCLAKRNCFYKFHTK